MELLGLKLDKGDWLYKEDDNGVDIVVVVVDDEDDEDEDDDKDEDNEAVDKEDEGEDDIGVDCTIFTSIDDDDDDEVLTAIEVVKAQVFLIVWNRDWLVNKLAS